MHLEFFVFRDVEGGEEFDVFWGKVISVDEHLADFIGDIGIFPVFVVVSLGEEARIAALDDRRGVGNPHLCQSLIAEFVLQLTEDISDVIVKSPADAGGHLLHSRQALTELWIHSPRLAA